MTRPIIFIFCVFALMISCNNNDNKESAQSIRPVKYIVVGNSDLKGQHNFTGLAKAQEEANLSFKVGGTINNILVKVGERVKRGQLLATLDPTDYKVSHSQSIANVQNSKAQIESAEAQVESARTNFITAESNYQRFEKLYETNSISLSDFEQAKSAYLGAEASYKAARTQVEAAKAGKVSSESMARSALNQVNYTRLTAPFAGIVTKINVEPNEVAGQGNPVLEINSFNNLNVEIGVPENTISEIKSDQVVKIKFNSIHDQEFEGVVHEIGYSSSGTTYPVTVRLKGNDERIRPGMPANATFTFDDHHSIGSALLVPPSAVGEGSEGNFVFLIKASGENYMCKKQKVKVGKLKDVGFEVISGLKQGDFVASAGLNVLRDGMLVNLYQKK